MNKLQELRELTNRLNEASDKYYNTGHPIMEDSEFDILLDELQKLENEYGVVLEDSPTINAGSRVAAEQKKITHEHPMLSLDKIHSVEEIQKFINGHDVIASVKCDGLSLAATYLNGSLVRLETRGNGTDGTDVMIHKNSIAGLPLHINHTGKYVVDGECIVKYDDFQAINNKLPESQQFSNPRNMASGSLNLLDSNISSTRGLTFVVWSVIEDSENFKDTMYENFKNAENLGFTVVPYTVLPNDNHENDNTTLDDILIQIKTLAEFNSIPMDGCVFSYNDIAYGKSLGKTSHHFNHSVAYKYDDDCAETILRDVTWTMGKVGTLCPTAIFDTVSLENTEVSRASLHNVSICKSLEIGIGDTITVKKCNQIIPQLQDNLTRSNTLEIPTHCPICGGETRIIKENASEVLMCVNPDCQGKLLGKLSHFVSKNATNIDGLSEQTLDKFINLGWSNKFQDIYHLSEHKSEMVKLDGFGSRSVNVLLANIEKSREIDLMHFIYSLSIPLIGKSASKTIAKEFGNGNISGFFDAWVSGYDFSQLEDFGDGMNQSMQKYINQNTREISELIDEFSFDVAADKDSSQNATNTNINGKTFVITGKLEHYKNRNELVSVIEQFGGKVSGSVSAKSDFLINNDINSNSSKNKKAKELNIPIITEYDFINMILPK